MGVTGLPGVIRVIRGGCFRTLACRCLAAFRIGRLPVVRRYYLGFRLVAEAGAGGDRVVRGGYFGNGSCGCRVAYRDVGLPVVSLGYLGFRPVAEVGEE